MYRAQIEQYIEAHKEEIRIHKVASMLHRTRLKLKEKLEKEGFQ